MPIQTSSQVGNYTLNIGAVSIAGSLLGMPIEALILGGIAGAVVQGLNPADSSRKGISSILASIVLAGSLSPLMMTYLISHFSLNEQVCKAIVPIVIGGGWTWIVPIIASYARKWLDGKLGKLFGGKS